MKGRMRVVPVGKVDSITASGTYAERHVGSDRYVMRESMQDLEERLDPAVRAGPPLDDRAARPRRGSAAREGGEYRVQLKSGARLRVGRSRREAVARRLGRTS
jgi:two-component system, LytTR family, response regulator